MLLRHTQVLSAFSQMAHGTNLSPPATTVLDMLCYAFTVTMGTGPLQLGQVPEDPLGPCTQNMRMFSVACAYAVT